MIALSFSLDIATSTSRETDLQGLVTGAGAAPARAERSLAPGAFACAGAFVGCGAASEPARRKITKGLTGFGVDFERGRELASE